MTKVEDGEVEDAEVEDAVGPARQHMEQGFVRGGFEGQAQVDIAVIDMLKHQQGGTVGAVDLDRQGLWPVIQRVARQGDVPFQRRALGLAIEFETDPLAGRVRAGGTDKGTVAALVGIMLPILGQGGGRGGGSQGEDGKGLGQ